MKRTFLMTFMLVLILFAFPVAARDYQNYYGKKVTVTLSKDKKEYTVKDKSGKSFKLKKCKKTMYVKDSDGLNVRKAPTVKSKIYTTLGYGAKVTVIGKRSGANKWVLVKYKGKYAFLWSQYLTSKKITKNYMGKFSITAYSYDGTRCANGRWPTVGYTVACNSLPLGTKVYIQGVGDRVVEDRGASWQADNWMDIYMASAGECYNWGVRYRDVYVYK